MLSNDSADDDDNYQRILSVPSANRSGLMYATCTLSANNPPETIDSNRMLGCCGIAPVYCSLSAIEAVFTWTFRPDWIRWKGRSSSFGASVLTKRPRIKTKSIDCTDSFSFCFSFLFSCHSTCFPSAFNEKPLHFGNSQ